MWNDSEFSSYYNVPRTVHRLTSCCHGACPLHITHIIVTLILLSIPIYASLCLNIFLNFLLVFYFSVSSFTTSRSFKYNFQSALYRFAQLNNICLTSSLSKRSAELPFSYSSSNSSQFLKFCLKPSYEIHFVSTATVKMFIPAPSTWNLLDLFDTIFCLSLPLHLSSIIFFCW